MKAMRLLIVNVFLIGFITGGAWGLASGSHKSLAPREEPILWIAGAIGLAYWLLLVFNSGWFFNRVTKERQSNDS